ncbi:g5361 [Coccomyxa elongata]
MYQTYYNPVAPASFYTTADLWISLLWNTSSPISVSQPPRRAVDQISDSNDTVNTGGFLIVSFTNEFPTNTGFGPPNKLTAGGIARFRIFDATYTVSALAPGANRVTVTYFINGVQSAVITDLGIFTDVTFNRIFVEYYKFRRHPTDAFIQNDYNYDVVWRNFHVNKGQYSALTAATLASVDTPHRRAGNFSPNPSRVGGPVLEH